MIAAVWAEIWAILKKYWSIAEKIRPGKATILLYAPWQGYYDHGNTKIQSIDDGNYFNFDQQAPD